MNVEICGGDINAETNFENSSIEIATVKRFPQYYEKIDIVIN